jgi:2-hydroxy-5-methyl-1-naphthoate 7-hydroxylase
MYRNSRERSTVADLPNTAHRLDPTGACPHAENARLMAQGSIVPVLLPDDVPGVAVVGYEALKEVLAHPEVSKAAGNFAALRDGRIPHGWPMLSFATVQSMNTADGDEHRRLRSLVAMAFTPRRVEQLEQHIRARTEQLLDGLERAAAEGDGSGTVDLRLHFALPLPTGVVCDLFGVDEKHWDDLHRFSRMMLSTSIAPEQVIAANQGMARLLAEVIATRTRHPADDLTSALIAAREQDGDRLSEPELIGTLLLMVVAGHTTTTNLIGNAVRALSANREQLELVQTGRVGWADVVEETLRWDSPVNLFPFRYPVRDLYIGEQVIAAGSAILAGYGAAGHDPEVFGPTAGQFDVTRTGANRHLSFGHGPHYCLGAPLARMEASIALAGLFGRFPDLAPAVPESQLRQSPTFIGSGVEELPVRLGRPAGAAGESRETGR